MAISFVAGARAAAATVALPAGIQPGDLLLVYAYEASADTVPDLAPGYTNIISGGANSNAHRTGWRIVQAGDTATDTGTWTGAEHVHLEVLRGTSLTAPIGASAQSSTTASPSYPGLTLQNPDGSSWVVGFLGSRGPSNNSDVAPSGMTFRGRTGSSTRAATNDTNGGVATWATVSGPTVSARNRTVTVEILSAPTYGGGATNADDTAAGAARAAIVSAGDAVDAGDATNGNTAVAVASGGAAVDTADLATGAVSAFLASTGGGVSPPDTADGQTTPGVSAGGDVTDSADTGAGAATAIQATAGAGGGAIALDDQASGSAAGSIMVAGTGSAVADMASGPGSASIRAAGNVIGEGDAASGSALVPIIVVVSGGTVDQPDVGNGTGGVRVGAGGSATGQDAAAGYGGVPQLPLASRVARVRAIDRGVTARAIDRGVVARYVERGVRANP